MSYWENIYNLDVLPSIIRVFFSNNAGIVKDIQIVIEIVETTDLFEVIGNEVFARWKLTGKLLHVIFLTFYYLLKINR